MRTKNTRQQRKLDLVVSQQSYDRVATDLKVIIKKLIPEHPEIMEMDDPWGLLKMKEFKRATKKLESIASVSQAAWALKMAKIEFREERNP